MLRNSPLLPALSCPAPRVLPPAGADLLGLRLPDRPGRRARLRVPEPPARADPGRPGRRAPSPRRSSRPSRRTTTGSPRPKRRPATPRPILPPISLSVDSEDETVERLEHGQDAAWSSSRPATRRWAYRYDPTRPEATAARQVVDDILQEAAGRVDPRHHPGRSRHRARITLHRSS